MGGAQSATFRRLGADWRSASLLALGAPPKGKGMGLCPTPYQGAALDPQGAMRPLTPEWARRQALARPLDPGLARRQPLSCPLLYYFERTLGQGKKLTNLPLLFCGFCQASPGRFLSLGLDFSPASRYNIPTEVCEGGFYELF